MVYGRPLRNLVGRMVQYLKEGTEAFEDPFPIGGRGLASGLASGRVLNWLSAFTPMQDSAFEDGDLGRPHWCGKRRGCPRGWTGCARSSRSGRRWA
ncbi:MAG: hypothetical protein RXR47_02565 [Nitrososphaeria archaeon]